MAADPIPVPPGVRSTERRHTRQRWIDAALLLGLASAVLVSCYRSGAFHADFAGDSDEPAHVVSALMIRAFVEERQFGHPVAFAEQYYVHYPKVAIGHWPPLFHVLEAMWTIVAGQRRGALIGFVAAIAAMLPACVFAALRRSCRRTPAFFAAALIATTGVVVRAAGTVEPNALLAAFSFCAALVYGRAIQTGHRAYRRWLAVTIAGAILTHGRGVALVLLPLWGTIMQRRAGARPRHFVWFAAALVVIWLVPSMLGQGARPSMAEIAVGAAMFPVHVVATLGWAISALSLAGMTVALARPRNEPMALAMAAQVASVWTFHSLVKVPFTSQYILPVAGAVAFLGAIGWREAIAIAPARARRVASLALVIIACAALTAEISTLPQKRDLGYHYLLENPIFADKRAAISLIAADPVSEGAYIAEMALRDRRIVHVVLRGSKVLATSSWAGGHYRPLFDSSAGIADFLDDAHVGIVIVSDVGGEPHEQALKQALNERASIWREDAAVGVHGVRVFDRIGPMPEGAPSIRIDMRDKIGRYLELAR